MLKLIALSLTLAAGLSFGAATAEAGGFSGITTPQPTNLKATPSCPPGSHWDVDHCTPPFQFGTGDGNGSQQLHCTLHHHTHCIDGPES